MRLEKSALWAEILGGAGILITLIILVFEVRENRSLIERQMRLERANLAAELTINSPYLPDILAKMKLVDTEAISSPIKAFMDQYDLTFQEAARFTTLLQRQWFGFEADYYAGTPDLEREMTRMLKFPDQQLFWNNAPEGLFGEEFSDFVDRINQ